MVLLKCTYTAQMYVLRAIFIFMWHKLLMIYLENLLFFHSAKNFEIFMGLIYPFMLCVCAHRVYVFVCVCILCTILLPGNTNMAERIKAFVYFHVILFVRDDFIIMKQKWLCGFSCCITLHYVRGG